MGRKLSQWFFNLFSPFGVNQTWIVIVDILVISFIILILLVLLIIVNFIVLVRVPFKRFLRDYLGPPPFGTNSQIIPSFFFKVTLILININFMAMVILMMVVTCC